MIMVGGISDHWDKTHFFKWCLNNHIAILEKDKKRAYFTQYTEINSKQVKDLKVKIETITRKNSGYKENCLPMTGNPDLIK